MATRAETIREAEDFTKIRISKITQWAKNKNSF
jgi:hypothetical protein